MIRHIVLCKVKAEADPAEVAAVWEGLAALVGVVPGLLGSHFGADVSPEGIGRGYTHGFTMDFEDMAALEPEALLHDFADLPACIAQLTAA